MTPMDVADLVDLELVKRLKYRYLRCLDQKLWDEIGGCFTPEAVAEYSAGAYTHSGRDAIVEFLRTSMGSEQMLSSHRCHHPLPAHAACGSPSAGPRCPACNVTTGTRPGTPGCAVANVHRRCGKAFAASCVRNCWAPQPANWPGWCATSNPTGSSTPTVPSPPVC